MTRADLIARLEAAHEGSRELDEAIMLLCYPAVTRIGEEWHMFGTKIRVESYSSSIDAALTLVPTVPIKGNPRMCTMLELYSDGTGNACVHHWDNRKIWSRCQATPALALVIAALRAAEATADTPEDAGRSR